MQAIIGSANGLEVITSENHASPTVAVQVWYHVGGKDHPAGRSGFAHLFEHLMFKSTRNLKSEEFDRLTEDVGGLRNAFTSDDVTAYHEVVPRIAVAGDAGRFAVPNLVSIKRSELDLDR